MDSSAESPVRNDIELGSVTHWPTVYAAAGVAAVVVVGLAAVVVLATLQPAPPLETPEAVAAVVPAPPPRPARPAVKTVEVVPAVPTTVSAPPKPTPAETAMVVRPPVPAPVAMVPTAVTPIIRESQAVAAMEPTPITPTPAAAPHRPYQGRSLEYENDLLADLNSCTKEIDLDTVEGTSAKLLGQQFFGHPSRDPLGRRRRETAVVVSPADAADHIVDLIAHCADLAGLPVSISPAVRDTAVTGKSLGHEPEPQTRKESPPRASDPALKALDEVSRELRPLQSRRTLLFGKVGRKPRDSEDPHVKLAIESRWNATDGRRFGEEESLAQGRVFTGPGANALH